MAKKMLIDATHAEETRVVVVDGNKVEEFDFESENRRQLAGNIYLAKVTRVEPSLQAAFVDYGGNRHGFLAFSEIHPDYYQIPVADREALMEEERAYAEAQSAGEEDDGKASKGSKGRSSRARKPSRSKAEALSSDDAIETGEDIQPISGMEMIDLDDTGTVAEIPEGTSPMETVAETPVEEPDDTDADPSEASGSDGESDEDTQDRSDAASKDDSIESVAEEDDSEDFRPVRKPRPRRYKIQEVIKVRQIILVQVVKEERGNKGAALTTYLSLAGRYCVLMPNTARGGGISRKITNAADRKKLKEIAGEIEVPRGAGLIVRTAGAKRTKAEIKRDYEYLQRLWEQIRELTLKSIAPAKIYEEGDLIKRSIRDLYSREIDEVLVEGDRGYRIAKDFMKMIMPSHAKNVRRYEEQLPLFARFQVESYLAAMFNPTVQLKSGGYIVIGVTEALVAIDVNSGRATKEGSIEETALKTNLEAAEEVARQLRLRDLAGLIVIDFIDMDERRNNASVEKKLKDKLKTDRARIQVGRISGFGLLEMSRQRLRPGMIEATTQPCTACHGTGLIRSDDNMSLSILRQIEEEGTRRRSREVLVRCPVGIANFLMNAKREHIAQIEARSGMAVRIEGDVHLVSPDFALEKFKTATRAVPAVTAPVVSVDSMMNQIDTGSDTDQDGADADESAESEAHASGDNGSDGDESKPKRKRKRRPRRRRGGSGRSDDATQAAEATEGAQPAQPDAGTTPAEADEAAQPEPAQNAPEEDTPAPAAAKPKSPRSRTRSSRSKTGAAGDTPADAPAPADEEAAAADAAGDATAVTGPVSEDAGETGTAAKKPSRTRSSRSRKKETAPEVAEDSAPETGEVVNGAAAKAATAPEPEPAAAANGASDTPASEETAPAPEPDKPKRRGWWSLGR
ncbi:MAG: Rne/Rng family ribonuclease [Jhaorihella sp.]